MPPHRSIRSVAEAWEVPRDLLLGRYPAFVTGGPLRRGEIPVFVFHGAEPEGFARQLQYLADNRYVTLSTDEYVAAIRGEKAAPERAVLLTFDDGRGSVWSIAAPLLKRRGMKATVFLVPGRMRSRPALGPTLDDVGAGRATNPDLARETSELALMSWEEVGVLSRCGLFDFQSHTLRHARVHTSPRLAGFVTPGSRQGYSAFDQPLVREGERDLLGDEVPLGTPLLESAPRTLETVRFFENAAVRRGCVAAVAEAGGERFFERPDWQERLRREFRRARVEGTLETRGEQARAIAFELTESRRAIEEHTGRPVVHLCYPWHADGPTARRLAADAGYLTAFCGKVPGVPITVAGGDLRRIARIGEDYVELLPGAGRSTLRELFRRKWARRFGRAAVTS